MDTMVLRKEREQDAVYLQDAVASEVCFQLYFNEVCVQEFYCMPTDFEALAMGFLLAEGKICNSSKVIFHNLCRGENGTYRLNVECDFTELSDKKGTGQIVKGIGKRDLYLRESEELNWDRAMNYAGMLLHASEEFQRTGCIHGAALCRDGKLLYFGEDISRFYAMYKAVGKAFLEGDTVSNFVLCTTGRLPQPYLYRVMQCGIGCVISRSAPTSMAIKQANQYGVCVFGFANSQKINYYKPSVGYCLLAGGKGSRVGGSDKALFSLKNVTFAERIFEEMQPSGEVIVSYNRDQESLEETLENLKLYSENYGDDEEPYPSKIKIIKDDIENIGPMGGIFTVLNRCHSGAILFAPCDLPFYKHSITEALLAGFTGMEDAVVMTVGGKGQPLCAIYSKSCMSVLQEQIREKNYRLKDLLAKLNTVYIDASAWNIRADAFCNINTFSEYEAIGERNE